jgi:hypothetical protein
LLPVTLDLLANDCQWAMLGFSVQEIAMGTCTLIPAADVVELEVRPDASPRKIWLDAFLVQRKLIEQGIRDGLPLDQRAERLRHGQLALPTEDLEDFDEIERIATLLDDKFDELLDIVLASTSSAKLTAKLPPQLEITAQTGLLRDRICREERIWLFVGGMQEILYQYRDRGSALIIEKRNTLLPLLSTSLERALNAVTQLNGYLVVEQAFDAEQLRQINQLLEIAPRGRGFYETALTTCGKAGIEALLEENQNLLRTQFTVACAQLCLQLFGNVSKSILQNLLTLKSIYILQLIPSEPDTTKAIDAERKYVERCIDRALKRIYNRAQREAWPVWPVLQLYHYDARLGRSKPKNRVELAD